ncbi:tripartite tricarboxylate transporter substrate binding protein [Acidovorax sp. JHL-9]|uniref:Bug family tripartite tricarboxylate transporter substrate binding protein n=1 Tax=Acidovorax sp. JHL-9 TaxID=1276756 RepID=UPI00041CDE94|nr:tripartite tricarboxylate transporter substrate binding protein [Acidovorax sp. JHL-9]
MKKVSRRAFNMALACGPLASMAPCADAQDFAAYPNRPIKIVVPFPPGSGTDNAARTFAKKIGEITGQGIAVENKPGANGFIAVNAVLNAPADGYTIFVGSNSTLTTNAAVFKILPYDPLKDLEPITILTRGPCVLIVPPDSPYQSLQDLIDDARKRPRVLNYGSGSISYRLYTEWFNHLVGITTTEVPYKGAGDVIKAVAGGEVHFGVTDRSGSVELVKGGRVRALFQAAKKRSPLMPNVPTSSEVGIPEYLADNWVAAAVSAKTPPALVRKIFDLFAKAGHSVEIRNYYANQSAELLVSTAEEMRQFQKDEIARWKRLAEVAKIPLQ